VDFRSGCCLTSRRDDEACPQPHGRLFPILTSDGLLLHTDENDNEAVSVLRTETINLAIPTQLEIEAELQSTPLLVVQTADYQSGVLISFVTDYGPWKCSVDPDQPDCPFGSTGAAAPARRQISYDDRFHRCRIVVDNPPMLAGTISVSWDDRPFLRADVQAPSRQRRASNTADSVRRLLRRGSGTSYWRYFRHNAATRTPGWFSGPTLPSTLLVGCDEPDLPSAVEAQARHRRLCKPRTVDSGATIR